jgi:hypothetical protein
MPLLYSFRNLNFAPVPFVRLRSVPVYIILASLSVYFVVYGTIHLLRRVTRFRIRFRLFSFTSDPDITGNLYFDFLRLLISRGTFQCSGSESLSFWAPGIRIRNYLYGSGSFHYQEKKSKKNFYCFMTSSWFFILEYWCECTFKK